MEVSGFFVIIVFALAIVAYGIGYRRGLNDGNRKTKVDK